jgi:neutral ceramidase
MPLPENCIVHISVANLGGLAIVFLPGEPFVQTGLDIEDSSPFEHTIVTGYAENSIGYVPPASAFDEGGYETGPGKWSYLNIYSERIIMKTAGEMLASLKTNIA